jgi:hypothetical protein
MQVCEKCQSAYDFSDEDLAFYAKMGVPKPKRCPECRLVRRLMERNARSLYYRKCDFSGRQIISTYHPNHVFPVYDQKVWWSDQWDGLDFGKDFDFNRPFFEQFKEFKDQVPHVSTYIIGGTLENSDFTNCTGYLKNCYLISESDYDEDCYYSNRLFHCNNMCDCSNCYNCERCYECVDCRSCYNLKYSQECENCYDSLFLKNCIDCKDCIGCVNQRHKQYMIFDKQYSKDEYEKKKAELNLENYDAVEKMKVQFEQYVKSKPHKAVEGEHNENVVGDHVYNSKNAFYCFDCKDLEDCKFCAKVASNVKNCMDYTSWGFKAELVYNSAACGDGIYNLRFCSTCTTNNSNLDYCLQCTSCSDLFACVGLKKKKYCIFNKQYSKEEYFILKEKIFEHMKRTGEWGEYFSDDICPFGYNETIAMDKFPLTKEEALAKGYKWCDYEQPVPDAKDVVRCSETGRPFRLNQQELSFYKKMNLPLPKKHPNQRHAARMAKRPFYSLVKKKCDSCNKEIHANVSTMQPAKILCEQCYLKELY